jgi:aldehyde dehydrogenase (NAD+)
VGRAARPTRGVQAGQVTINGFASSGVIGAPCGGYGRSGLRRSMSAAPVLDYAQLKTVIINAAE